MNFASDNAYGVLPEIWDALARAGDGAAPSYGGDAITARTQTRVSEIFER